MELNLGQLNNWQQRLFAAALAQRMLPNYAFFAQATQFGDYDLLRNQMDIIWQKLSMQPISFSVEAQLEKLEPNIPQVSNFDLFAVYPAIDACTAIVCLLESFADKNSDCANELSRLSLTGVESFINFRLSQESTETHSPEELQNDPLIQWEMQVQLELFEFVLCAKESREYSQDIKAMVVSQHLTNLAIEY